MIKLKLNTNKTQIMQACLFLQNFLNAKFEVFKKKMCLARCSFGFAYLK